MPRYLFRTAGSSAADVDAAMAVAASRFPEIGVEHRFVERGEHRHEVWVCTAPSLTHVVRWVAEAALAPDGIEQVDDLPIAPAARRRVPDPSGVPARTPMQEEHG